MTRRINIRFLVTAALVAVGAIVAIAFIAQLLLNQDPQKYAQWARVLMQQGRFGEAVENFQQAIALDSANAALRVEFGDALSRMAETNSDFAYKDRAQWIRALELDPKCMPALTRLLEVSWQSLMVSRENISNIAERVQEYASRILTLNPKDLHAKGYLHMAFLQVWMANVQVDPKRVDADMAALAELIRKDPANADLPSFLARAKIFRGQQLTRIRDTRRANALFAEAMNIVDQSLQAQPNNVAMCYRASQVLSILLNLQPASETVAYAPRIRQLLERARARIKPNESLYVDVNAMLAELLSRYGEPARAETIYRELLTNRPNDPGIRYLFANALRANPAKRDEAIRLLEAAIVSGQFSRGEVGSAMRELEARTLQLLTEMRLDSSTQAKSDSEREALLAQCREGITKVVSIAGESPDVLKLRGKMQLVQGQAVEAIKLFERSAEMQKQLHPMAPRDYDVMFLLARAYMATEQSGQARILLTELVTRFEKFILARVLLVQLLLRENAMDEARRHIEVLERLAPDDPQVVQFRLVTLDPAKQKEQVRSYYAKLPEGDRQLKIRKAQYAVGMNMPEEAIRLLKGMLKENPGDAEIVLQLTRIYVGSGNKAEARQIIAEARKVNPGHKGLLYLERQLDNVTQEELRKLIVSEVMQIVDDYTRELQLHRIASEEGNALEAFQHLRKAEAAKPDAPEVLDLMFQHYLREHKWDFAKRYMEQLVRENRDGAGGLLYRFRFTMAKNDIAGALAIGKELTEKLPEFSQSWLSYAQALQANGQIGEAISRFMLALEKRADNVEAIKGIVQCYYAQNRPVDAKRHIDRACKSMPRNAVLQEMLLNHEIAYGDPANAVPSRQAALQADPGKPANWSNLGLVLTKAAQVRAGKSPEEAKAFLKQARDVFTQAVERWPDEMLLYGYLGDVLLFSGEFEQGEKSLRQLTQREAWKNHPSPYLMLAEYYARGGKMKEAEAAMRDALVRDSGNPEILLRLANLLMLRKQTDEALKTLEAGSSDSRLTRRRIEILLSLGRVGDAERLALSDLEKNPRNADTLSVLGYIYLKAGRFADSAQRVEQALAADPNNVAAHYFRGLILLAQPKPDFDEALRELQVVRQQNPGNPEVRWNVADAFCRKGNVDGAIRELEAAVQAIPENGMVRMRLAELYGVSRPPRWFDLERLIQETKSMPQFARDAEWYVMETRMWMGRNDADKAIAAAQRAVELSNYQAEMVQLLLDVLIQTRRYQEALQATESLLSNSQRFWWIYIARGTAHNRLGEKDAAMGDFETALKLAADGKDDASGMRIVDTVVRELGAAFAVSRVAPRAENNLLWTMVAANLYHLVPDDANAIKMIERVMGQLDKLQPRDRITALRLAGEIYLRAKPHPDLEKAIQTYQYLLQNVPEDYTAMNNLACVLAEGVNPPRPQEALVYSQRAYDLMTKSGTVEPLILDTHGWVLTLCGQTKKGILLIRDAADRLNIPEIRYHLAEAYLRESMNIDAEKELVAAKGIIEKMKQGGRSVDSTLEGKVENALTKVRALLQAGNKKRS